MPSLIQMNFGVYYAQFYDSTKKPKRKRISLETKVKTVARCKFDAMVEDYKKGRYDPFVQPFWDFNIYKEPLPKIQITLSDSVNEYLKERKTILSSTTYDRYENVLFQFKGYFELKKYLSQLTSEDIKAFITSSKKRKIITQKSHLNDIRTFVRWCIRRGYLNFDLTEEIELGRIQKKFPRFLSPVDVETIIAQISEYDQYRKDNKYIQQHRYGIHDWLIPIIKANVYLGLRRSELLNVKWKDVDLHNGLLYVRNSIDFTTKNSRERTIPLSTVPHMVISELPKTNSYVFKHVTRDHLTKTFKKYARLADLPEEINFHSLRHTAISWLALSGLDIEAIRQFAGHSSIVVTQRYMHLSPTQFHDRVRSAFDRI